MRRPLLALAAATVAACVPSRGEVLAPVDRELARRLGPDPVWHGDRDPRIAAAVAARLRRPLDRDAVVRIALATNRRLQAAYDELGIAASELGDATVLGPTEVELELQPGAIELDVVQDVLALIQLPQRRGVAHAALAAARARAVAATLALVARVEQRFVDVVAARQQVELRQTAFDAAAASAELAERMHAAGNVPELAMLRERDQREQARVELDRAGVELAVARAALDAELGLTGAATGWTTDAHLPDLPAAPPALDALERDAVATSLELAAIRSDGDAAAGRLGIARVRAAIPVLAVGVAADREDGGWDLGPALRFGLPIFDQQQGPRARARAELARARNLATATEVELRARARAARQRVLGAYAEARRLHDVVLPLRQRIVDETLRHYNAMNASTFDLLTSRRELVDAGHAYLDALRRFWRAAAEVRAIARGARPELEPGSHASEEP